MEGKASKDSFTNDLNVVDALIINKASKTQQAAQQARIEQQQSQTLQQSSQNDAVANDREERRKQISASISALKQQKDSLSNRIRAAAAEREHKGLPRDGGSHEFCSLW